MIKSNTSVHRSAQLALRQGFCGPAALAAVILVAGCSGVHAARQGLPGTSSQGTQPARSLVRVPRPDYASPASVAAAFYVAWGDTDTLHDEPASFASRCAPLATSTLERQLAASQPATASWQSMRRERLVSLVRVTAVTHPDGAPAATPSSAYLRVYAVRVTTTTEGRTTTSDGMTLRLTKAAGRWLVSTVLFY